MGEPPGQDESRPGGENPRSRDSAAARHRAAPAAGCAAPIAFPCRTQLFRAGCRRRTMARARGIGGHRIASDRRLSRFANRALGDTAMSASECLDTAPCAGNEGMPVAAGTAGEGRPAPVAEILPAIDAPLPGPAEFLPGHPVNPLVGAAYPLLEIGGLLRTARCEPMPLEALRGRLIAMVREFVDACVHLDTETVAAARYCLCTFLDEAVAAAPWGGEAWSTRSLLVIFHGEASGGERFFTILHKLSQNPAAHIDALELLHIMLALGMQGRYRLSPDGSATLLQVRQKLRALIRQVRGAPEASLSPHWRGEKPYKRTRWPARPLAWLCLGCACLAAAMYGLAAQRLRQQALAAALARQAVHAKAPVAPLPAAVAAQPARPPDTLPAVTPAPVVPATRQSGAAGMAASLAHTLAGDIAAGRVQVESRPDRVILTVGTDTLFASGSSRIAAAYLPLVRRIGDALRTVRGRVLVIGHTDNRPPAPGAPSNWALSLARAGNVLDVLREQTGEPERFLAQGKGDTEPVASNDTPAGQARNRRVVIVVLAPGAAA
ncbi:hypothetical protein CAL14_03950 [Bordetella genomosp. 9]|nr:hypothetical protein CAL14_03950 [Bordetella genomosp. 9]